MRKLGATERTMPEFINNDATNVIDNPGKS